MSVAHQMHRLFFDNKVFRYSPNKEGQYCESSLFFVGDRAGPSRNLSNLLHEVCHFAEREKDALEKRPNNWGFYYGKFWQIGTQWGYEPRTSEQVDRESRVWAFQLACQRQLGLDDNSCELVRSATYLPAWCYFSKRYAFKEKKSLFYLSRRVERMSRNRWNFQRLLDDFHERVDFLSGNGNELGISSQDQ